jgi:hypothetical protein
MPSVALVASLSISATVTVGVLNLGDFHSSLKFAGFIGNWVVPSVAISVMLAWFPALVLTVVWWWGDQR